jgi:hypothetical protein
MLNTKPTSAFDGVIASQAMNRELELDLHGVHGCPDPDAVLVGYREHLGAREEAPLESVSAPQPGRSPNRGLAGRLGCLSPFCRPLPVCRLAAT